jgi:transcriptional regulator with XRE-family HTH domain
MNYLKIAENIIALRHKKGITQDELANFLGVTKASVSKWETKQSYPDILLLPQIASYFNISIDELLGYEPEMSSEQIMKCYQDLAADFSKLPFDTVVEKSQVLVKKYYSCFPLLMQVVLLWINHYMLTQDREQQTLLLKEAVKLCDHVRDGSNDVRLCNDAIALKAVANLTLGSATEVIEELQPLLEQKQFLLQSDSVLIQAYLMSGDISKADLHSQVTVYTYLLSMIDNSMGMINFNMQNQGFCEITIRRIRQIIDVYNLEQLHPNTALRFHYQAAIYYGTYNQIENALDELSLFVTGSLEFISSGLELHGDDYFNRLEEWFEEFALKKDAPRNGKVVLDSLLPAMEHPAMACLFALEEYKKLKNKIERKREEV